MAIKKDLGELAYEMSPV